MPADSGSQHAEPLLRLRGLTRRFQSRTGDVWALRGVDLDVLPGEIVGLLGVNGAGKTTLLKVISTLLLPTGGEAALAGYDVVRQPQITRRLTSVVFGGERGFYDRLSATENIRFFALLSGHRPVNLDAACDSALERVGLGGVADHAVETFSRGMKQRLHLAIGLLSRPRLLLLDEPTVGLDPIEAEKLRRSVLELRDTDTAVILTSHYLGDIERMASRVVILQGGTISHDLPLRELLAQAGTAAEVILSGSGPVPRVHPEAINRDGVRIVTPPEQSGPEHSSGWHMTLEVDRWSPDSLMSLARAWPDAGVLDVRVEPVSLERVFARLSANARQS